MRIFPRNRNAWQQLMTYNRFKKDPSNRKSNGFRVPLNGRDGSSADYLRIPNSGAHLNGNGPNFVENQSYGFDNNNRTNSNFYESAHVPQLARINNSTPPPAFEINNMDCKLNIENNSNDTVIPILVENRVYELMASSNRGKYLTSEDLLNFSKQIATGMVRIVQKIISVHFK